MGGISREPPLIDSPAMRRMVDNVMLVRKTAFPSLSLMQQPARGFETCSLMDILRGPEEAKPKPAGAASPRLRLFPGGPGRSPQWRCQIDGTLCTGWGNTRVRAWNAWVDAYSVWHPLKKD